MQTALLVNAVDPSIGGVLVRGEKGTAKSTAVRALASLLPPIESVDGCPYHCPPDAPDLMHNECRARYDRGDTLQSGPMPTPFVDLPLSTTEDRLVGTIHLGKTLQSGERHYQPGLLAAANRGILYVDEVNLLPDHLVDLLLDVATTGVNLVEREGIRIRHPARFVLIGSMNPEEGELRPQFLDRFGLCVMVSGLQQAQLRHQIVLNRLEFENDPAVFTARYCDREELLRQQVNSARRRLPAITIGPAIIDRAVHLAENAKVQGHRAELAMVRTARALAALCDRDCVVTEDLFEAARFALPHRIGSTNGLLPEDLAGQIEQLFAEQGMAQKEDSTLQVVVDDLDVTDNMNFPGSAAAGSMLFTYLKKKLKTATSPPTRPLA